MGIFWVFVARIRALAFRNRMERDLEDELQAHLELLTLEYRRSGMNPDQAARAARLRLGGAEQVKEEVRDTHRLPWIANFVQDAYEALRRWRRQPAVVAVTVATMAVGVGANLAMYDLVNALMFRPPEGVTAPSRIVSVRDADNYIRYSDIRDGSKSLEAAAYTRQTLSLGAGGNASPVCVECVTPTFFPVLGTRPVVGRIFGTDEDTERREPGVLLSYTLWRRDFAGDPGVLGRSITISGRKYTVIGIAPMGFRGVEQDAVDAWLLLPASPDICSFTGRSLLGDSSGHWLNTIGRLRDGVTLSQAAAELESHVSPEVKVERARSHDRSPWLEPLEDFRRNPDAERLALWLAAGAIVMLLIACANIAGLSSIRALDRRREFAVRLQLGADRSRILVQYAAEQLMLALLAAAIAALTAGWMARVLQDCFSYRSDISLFDWRLFAAAFCLALPAGILSGLAPAFQASRVDATSQANCARLRYDRKAPRKALLVLQVALALVLAVDAGLFERSVLNTREGLGIEPDHVVQAAVDLEKAGYRDAREIKRFFEQIAVGIRRLPGIESVSISSGSLLGSGTWGTLVLQFEGVNGKNAGFHALTAVTPEYFSTVGTRILEGRAFTRADDEAAERVIIIDACMAGKLWPGEQAIGRYVTIRRNAIKVVGVCESHRTSAAFTNYSGAAFVPFAQAGAAETPHAMMIRTRGPAVSAASQIAAVVRGSVPKLPFISVQPVEDLVNAQTRSWRIGRAVFSSFGTGSLLLASLGLYAVLAFSVRQRVSEIGVRIAVGASRADIVRLVLRQGLLLAGTGWLLGVGSALLTTKQIEKLLFRVEPVDTVSFVLASLCVLAAALAGCLVPSIRAARVDPVIALRHE